LRNENLSDRFCIAINAKGGRGKERQKAHAAAGSRFGARRQSARTSNLSEIGKAKVKKGP